ncbi:MAG: HAD-IIB family hydrolase [Cyanobacteriota bacterium]|nr:HAD-IIB family hydrolase [Cyanobacteriota bacterium]
MSYNFSLVLATDLDGTFLGGSDSQRSQFYEYVESSRSQLLLVFVTGRSLHMIDELCEIPGFPRPDYIIGDVGTTIFEGRTFKPVAKVQDWIRGVWNDANDRVKTLLENEPGLELQPLAPDYRVSYYYDSEKLQSSTIEKIRESGFDCIMSDNRFLDVMPKGVSKGPTLLKAIEALNLERDRVVTAGDTLNDLSLFETGLQGIAVGNAEPKLVEKIKEMDNVYHSTLPGAAGIWEGLKHYEKVV